MKKKKRHLSPTKRDLKNCVRPECPVCQMCEFGLIVYPDPEDDPFPEFFETYCTCTKEKKEEWLAQNGEWWKAYCKENGLTGEENV